MTSDKLTKFTKRYAEAWCSLVTGHKIDNDGLIAQSEGHFGSAEYERQLKHGVDVGRGD